MTRKTASKEQPLVTRCKTCGAPARIEFGVSWLDVAMCIVPEHHAAHERIHEQERKQPVSEYAL